MLQCPLQSVQWFRSTYSPPQAILVSKRFLRNRSHVTIYICSIVPEVEFLVGVEGSESVTAKDIFSLKILK